MTGRVVHFELPADDTARARAFYQEAFGWSINDVPEMDYALVTTVETDETGTAIEAGGINGGIMKREEPLTAPIITIDVDDIDGALAQIEHLGGAVIRGRLPVGSMGFSAYFRDTEGNVVGLWQAAEPG